MMAVILNSAILISTILDSAILVFALKLIHTSLPTICTKNFTHSFWLNLMMVVILISAILNSAILDSTSVLWNSDILAKIGSLTICIQKHSPSHFLPHHLHSKTSPIHSHSTWWWQPSWILPSWISSMLDSAFAMCGIQTPCFLLSDSLKHTLPLLWLWLNLIHSDSKSFIPTQLDDGGHLEFWLNLDSWLLASWNSATLLSSLRITQKHSPSTLTLTQTNSIWLKLIHSHSTWWWQPSWILPSWIWPSWNQPS